MMVWAGLHPIHSTAVFRRALGGLAALAVAGAMCSRSFRRVRVTGDSMLPTFRTGDRLLIGPAGRVRAGHVVAVRDPRSDRRLLVKRVHAAYRRELDVRGDNAAASTDSRHLGLIPRSKLAGRVVYRYAPAERTGWFPGDLSRRP
jgi:nickel-type superoxide dismutase maturation protease